MNTDTTELVCRPVNPVVVPATGYTIDIREDIQVRVDVWIGPQNDLELRRDGLLLWTWTNNSSTRPDYWSFWLRGRGTWDLVTVPGVSGFDSTVQTFWPPRTRGD